MKSNKFHYAYMIVLSVCAFYGMMLGLLGYTVGNFYLPISNELHCGVGEVALYSTISGFVMAFLIPIFRSFTEKNINLALSIGSILMVVSLIGFSRASAIWHFYIWSIIMGAGNAFYNGATLPSLIKRWFAEKSGTALGLGLAFAALLGAIMNPVIASIIGKIGWRGGYIVLAFLVAVLTLPFSIFVVKSDPVRMGLKPYGYKDNNESSQIKTESTGPLLSEAKKMPEFYLLLLACPMFSLGFGFTSHLAAFGSTVGLSPTLGAALTSASLIGGMLGKLSLGMLGDRFGARVPFSLAQLCVVGGVSLVYLGKIIPILFVLGTFLFGYGACTTALMPAMLCSAVFGNRDYNKILTWFTTATSFVGGLGATIYGFLYDFNGNYNLGMIFCICIATLCLILGSIALSKKGARSK